MALPTATIISETDLFQHGLILGCRPFRVVPALSWAYPWPHSLRYSSTTLCTATSATRCICCSTDDPQPQMLPSVPSLAWTYPWATTPSEAYLLWCRHNHGCRMAHPQGRFLQLKFILEPAQESSTGPAAMLWLPASPGPSPLPLSKCSQAKHFSKEWKQIWSLMNTGL